MRIECPNCKRVINSSVDRVVSIKYPLEVTCHACRYHVRLGLKAFPPAEKLPDLSPRTPEALLGRIDPSLLEADDLPNMSLQKSRILRGLINLPSIPHIILKAQEIIADPDASLRDLANVIEADQAIVAKVLTLANSAYYGVSGTVASVQHASVLLGQKTLGELITISASSELMSRPFKGYDIQPEEMWKHSLSTAFASRRIARQHRPELAEDAFVVGLLHDTGKIILDPYVGKLEKTIRRLLAEGGRLTVDAEKELLGFDHAEIMARACRFWRFPESQITAIRYHHDPAQAADSDLTLVLHAGNYLAKLAGYGVGDQDEAGQLEEGVLEFLGLSRERLIEITESVKGAVAKIEADLGGDRGLRPSV
jgi:HD-like signal output (HDOD) protein